MRGCDKMPKGKLVKRNKGHNDGISLHFKELHDSEEELEAELEQSLRQDGVNVTTTKSSPEQPEIQTHSQSPLNAVVNSPLQTALGKDCATSFDQSTQQYGLVLETSEDGVESKDTSLGPSGDTSHLEIQKHNEDKGEIISSNQSTSRTILVSHLEGVKEHPLLHQSSSNEGSDSDDVMEHPKVSVPSLMGIHSTEEEPPNDRAITKAMLSNAFFDSKTRTQLISSLKKNLQHYTSSTATGKSDLDTSESKKRSSSLFSDNQTVNVQSSKSETVKVLKEKAMEPLQAVKRALEDSWKDSQQGDIEESRVRTRSSSENNFPSFRVTKRFDPDNPDVQGSKPGMAVPRSSSMAMSLSGLLAERQESQDDVAIVVAKSVKDGGSQKRDAFFTPKQKLPATPKQVLQTSRDVKSANTSHSNGESSPSINVLFFMTITIYLYYTLPLPSYVHVAVLSFCFGIGVSVSVLCLVVTPRKPSIVLKPPYVTQSVPSQIPQTVLDPKEEFKGWMNEIEVYDIETYHTSATYSVFVTLGEKTLRLQTPRRNISRRAAHGERKIQVTNVIRQRILEISKAKVYLVPSDLVKKRVWSKKYPICLEFSNNSNGDTSSESLRYEKGNDESGNTAPEAYDVISKDDLTEKIYLFGRTQPQKERWFYRFQRAIAIAREEMKTDCKSHEKVVGESDGKAQDPQHTETLDDKRSGSFNPIEIYDKYYKYMSGLMPDPSVYLRTLHEATARAAPKTAVGVDLDHSKAIQFSSLASQSDAIHDVVLSQPKPILGNLALEPGLDVAWFNVVVGRIMFDFLRLQKWADWVSNKLQKKLEKIRLPYFMDGLKLTEIDLGKTVPLVHKISLPRIDAKGIWLDMDITYNGAVQMTLETKMVLTRLGKQQTDQMKLDKKAAAMNSDEEDSAESSEDEESLLASSLPTYVQHLVPKGSENVPTGTKTKTGFAKASSSPKLSNSGTPTQEKRWVRIVDSITKSKYFKKVTETNYIKKKFETVSNTPLILTAELNQCQGTICINIPPPPSDRLWYGFKEPPTMVLKARPKLGERAVKATPITDWIEKKLIQEFNKVFLIPNMDDIPVPLMFNNLPSST